MIWDILRSYSQSWSCESWKRRRNWVRPDETEYEALKIRGPLTSASFFQHGIFRDFFPSQDSNLIITPLPFSSITSMVSVFPALCLFWFLFQKAKVSPFNFPLTCHFRIYTHYTDRSNELRSTPLTLWLNETAGPINEWDGFLYIPWDSKSVFRNDSICGQSSIPSDLRPQAFLPPFCPHPHPFPLIQFCTFKSTPHRSLPKLCMWSRLNPKSTDPACSCVSPLGWLTGNSNSTCPSCAPSVPP